MSIVFPFESWGQFEKTYRLRILYFRGLKYCSVFSLMHCWFRIYFFFESPPKWFRLRPDGEIYMDGRYMFIIYVVVYYIVLYF